MSIEKSFFESRKEEQLDLNLGDGFLGIPIRVVMKDGKVSEVLDDIDKEGFYSYNDADFKKALTPFFKAKIEVNYEAWTSDDNGEYGGFLAIKKADINKAIADGKISISKNKDGDLIIQ